MNNEYFLAVFFEIFLDYDKIIFTKYKITFMILHYDYDYIPILRWLSHCRFFIRIFFLCNQNLDVISSKRTKNSSEKN